MESDADRHRTSAAAYANGDAANASSSSSSSSPARATPALRSSSSSSVAGAKGTSSASIPADALDYFSETTAKLGTDGSTGVMIQSPDGRPAGIFFHPRTNTGSSTTSSNNSVVAGTTTTGHSVGGVGSSNSTTSPASLVGQGVESGVLAGKRTGIGGSSGAAATAATGGVGMMRRGSNDDRAASAPGVVRSSREGGGAAAKSAGLGTSSGTSTPRSNASSPLNEPPLIGINTTNGNIFTPQVGLHSILSGQRPPTATPLIAPQGDASAASMTQIPLSELTGKASTPNAKTMGGDEGTAAYEAVKGDRADKDDAQPRSPIETDEPLSLSATLSTSSPSKNAGKQTSSAAAARAQSRRSFGAFDGTTAANVARQTFGSTQATAAVARPSAQPQSGLLIGAGFSQPRRKGALGPKRAATNIEVLPPIKVLIVEDNPINVKILSTFLKQRKIKYGVARDGREAVHEWQTGGYHLILMDIQLPVMDGIEATKEIRRLEQEANIGPIPAATPSVAPAERSAKELGGPGDVAPMTASGTTSPLMMLQNSLRASVIIVALTASVLNSDRVAALAAGCNDFLNKPVDLRWLERKVIEWGSMQYLISFREGPGDPIANVRRKTLRKTYLSPTHSEVLRSEGLVDRAFNTGPDQLARELAGKLYIGGKKTRLDARPTQPVGQ